MDVPDCGFLGGCWLVCQTRARVRLGVDESVSWLKRLCDGQPSLVRAVQKLPNAGVFPSQVFPKGIKLRILHLDDILFNKI